MPAKTSLGRNFVLSALREIVANGRGRFIGGCGELGREVVNKEELLLPAIRNRLRNTALYIPNDHIHFQKVVKYAYMDRLLSCLPNNNCCEIKNE